MAGMKMEEEKVCMMIVLFFPVRLICEKKGVGKVVEEACDITTLHSYNTTLASSEFYGRVLSTIFHSISPYFRSWVLEDILNSAQQATYNLLGHFCWWCLLHLVLRASSHSLTNSLSLDAFAILQLLFCFLDFSVRALKFFNDNYDPRELKVSP